MPATFAIFIFAVLLAVLTLLDLSPVVAESCARASCGIRQS